MKLPATDRDLTDSGYVRTGIARCTGNMCQTWIHWYRTPTGKMMPFSKVPGIFDLLEAHFVACISAKQFRRKA